MLYHPGLSFQFPVPTNWQLNNTPSQVQMITEQQDAVLVFSLAKANSPSAAAQTFISNSKATVKKNEQIRVNGLQAQRVISEIYSEQQVISIISYFIKKTNNIFVFHGYSSQSQLNAYLLTFKKTMSKFKILTNRRKINTDGTL